jgi:hypothetical protein
VTDTIRSYNLNFHPLPHGVTVSCEHLACWPLVPKIASSNLAEAVGFFGRKIHSMPCFGGEVKPSVPCHRFAACKRTPAIYVEVRITGKIDRPFLAQFRPSLTEVSHVAWRGAPLEMTDRTKGGAQRASSLRPKCIGEVDPKTMTHIYLSILQVLHHGVPNLLWEPEGKRSGRWWRVTLHIQTCSGHNRIIPLMWWPNTDSVLNVPVTLPCNQLLIHYVITSPVHTVTIQC